MGGNLSCVCVDWATLAVIGGGIGLLEHHIVDVEEVAMGNHLELVALSDTAIDDFTRGGPQRWGKNAPIDS